MLQEAYLHTTSNGQVIKRKERYPDPEKITKRCYKKFDKGKFKSDLRKVSRQKHCNYPDPNVSMKHFLKIVHTLLERHAPFKSFNKKASIYSSKPWITTGIARSIKVKDNSYKNFSSETNLHEKAKYQNLFRTYQIFPLSLDAQRTHFTMDFLKKAKEILKQSGNN